MSFASPLFFWAFLFLVPLLAIYWLKVRPVRKPTTAYFLWNEIFQEKKATSLFQRFRDLFSLLLMALAIAAIVMALTRPEWNRDQQADLVLLIDNSVSMNTRDGSSTRLGSAKSVARDIVRALDGTQRCSVASVSDTAQFRSNLTDNPRELLDAIDQIQPGYLPSRIQPLMNFVNSEPVSDETVEPNSDKAEPAAPESKTSQRVILISDGCIGEKLPTGMELIKVGTEASGNVGLVAADLQRVPASDSQASLFFQLASSFDEPVEAELLLSFDTPENLVKLIPLQVQPGVNPAEVVDLTEAEAGKWWLQLELSSETDNLLDDNTAYLTIPPLRPIAVGIATEDRYFYENSVLAFARSGDLLTLADDSVPAQLKIAQKEAGSVSSTQGDNELGTDWLIFYPQGNSPWWNDVGEEIDVTIPRAIDPGHPVIRHLDIDSVPFVGARRLNAPPGSELLVVAEDDTPLIYRTNHSGQSAVVVNLDPSAAEFYLSAYFPVLVYSAATHLAGRTERLESVYPTGDLVPIPGATPGQQVVWAGPEGLSGSTSETVLGPLTQPGHYTLGEAESSWLVGCSVINRNETINNDAINQDTSEPINRGSSPMAWLTIVAILVLAVESMLYQRRKVG